MRLHSTNRTNEMFAILDRMAEWRIVCMHCNVKHINSSYVSVQRRYLRDNGGFVCERDTEKKGKESNKNSKAARSTSDRLYSHEFVCLFTGSFFFLFFIFFFFFEFVILHFLRSILVWLSHRPARYCWCCCCRFFFIFFLAFRVSFYFHALTTSHKCSTHLSYEMKCDWEWKAKKNAIACLLFILLLFPFARNPVYLYRGKSKSKSKKTF